MDDIIDRINKCVESAEAAGWEDVGFPEDLLIECRDEIAKLRSPWVSVDDDTPGSDEVVLAWNSGNDGPGNPWAMHAICDLRNGEWREANERDLFSGVTHWMPLPAPPTDGK